MNNLPMATQLVHMDPEFDSKQYHTEPIHLTTIQCRGKVKNAHAHIYTLETPPTFVQCDKSL